MTATERLHRLPVFELAETDGTHRPVLRVHVLSIDRKESQNPRCLEVVRFDLLDVVGATVPLDAIGSAGDENQKVVAATQQSHHLHGNKLPVHTETKVRTICQNVIGTSSAIGEQKNTLIITTDRNRQRRVLLDELQQLNSNRVGDSDNWNGDLR